MSDVRELDYDDLNLTKQDIETNQCPRIKFFDW